MRLFRTHIRKQASILEAEGMHQIFLHGLARQLQKCYPSLWTTRGCLERAWRKAGADGELRQGTWRIVGEFLGLEGPCPMLDEPAAFSSCCREALSDAGKRILRVYVALTEAYNCRATPSFLHRREWLCPWQRWKMYVPPPLWECEASFIRVAAAFGRVPDCIVGQQVLEPPSAQVRETVVALAAQIADAVSLFSAGGDTAAGPALRTIRGELARDRSLRKREADLAAVLRYYLLSGRMLLVRRWWGYQDGSPPSR